MEEDNFAPMKGLPFLLKKFQTKSFFVVRFYVAGPFPAVAKRNLRSGHDFVVESCAGTLVQNPVGSKGYRWTFGFATKASSWFPILRTSVGPFDQTGYTCD